MAGRTVGLRNQDRDVKDIGNYHGHMILAILCWKTVQMKELVVYIKMKVFQTVCQDIGVDNRVLTSSHNHIKTATKVLGSHHWETPEVWLSKVL